MGGALLQVQGAIGETAHPPAPPRHSWSNVIADPRLSSAERHDPATRTSPSRRPLHPCPRTRPRGTTDFDRPSSRIPHLYRRRPRTTRPRRDLDIARAVVWIPTLRLAENSKTPTIHTLLVRSRPPYQHPRNSPCILDLHSSHRIAVPRGTAHTIQRAGVGIINTGITCPSSSHEVRFPLIYPPPSRASRGPRNGSRSHGRP